MKLGFDNERYVKEQTEKILNRIALTPGNKLYLEFGGKLLDDGHAARVLPGFDPQVKIKILETLKNDAEVIIAISANDLERNKIRSDSLVDYGTDTLRLIEFFKSRKIDVNSVVITQYANQMSADIYKRKLERRNIKVYIHTKTKGYPTDIETIISDEGYGQNPYIKTTKKLVVVTAPGPGSGKLATCLCQLYHEFKNGSKAGYAKYETFPVWNLPLKHPVNIAYEAATADLKDVNMIDIFHLEAYGEKTVNYNRDIEVFPVVKSIISKIMGEEIYKSPTDMGVNMIAHAIVDDELCSNMAKKEVLRRYFKAQCDYVQGLNDKSTQEKIEYLMSELNISVLDRPVVMISKEKSEKEKTTVIAIELEDGKIITGKEGSLLSAASAMLLNAIKYLAKIDDEVELISSSILKPILKMKKDCLKEDKVLTLEETLVALSISATGNTQVKKALDKVGELSKCDAHASSMINKSDDIIMHKMNIYLTTEPIMATYY